MKTSAPDAKGVISAGEIDMGSGYYYFGCHVEGTGFPAKIEVRIDSPDGRLLGTAIAEKPGLTDAPLREANGKHHVFLVIREGQANISSARIFAGFPKPLADANY